MILLAQRANRMISLTKSVSETKIPVFFLLVIIHNYIQIHPVSEGYLRKIPVERRGKYPEPL
jgi:hypothetical protein